jgi:hypothetical protein
MSLDSAAIATGIAALDVDGITILDVTAIPESVTVRDCPLMFPSPDGWLTGGNQEGPATFGTPTSRYWTFQRNFDYVYLHTQVGVGRGLRDHIGPMATNMDTIMTALTELDLANVDVLGVQCTAFGQLLDPAGNSFFGCHVQITVREVLNP